MSGLNNYRNADPSLPYQPAGGAGAQVEGQESQARNGTGGQFIDRFVPLPDTESLLGRPLKLSDVVVGIMRHQNAISDLTEAMRLRSEA